MKCDCYDCNPPLADARSALALAWMATHWKLWRNRVVSICPPGTAEGAMHFRNRGLAVSYEITCWPKQKAHLQTTGATNNVMRNLNVKAEYEHIGWVLRCGAVRAADWMEEWRKEAKRLVHVRETLLTVKPTIELRRGYWTVRGKTKEGVYTSAQRKFLAWEQAANYVKELSRSKADFTRVEREQGSEQSS